YETQEVIQQNAFFVDSEEEQIVDINDLIKRYSEDSWNNEEMTEEEMEILINEERLNDAPGEGEEKPLPEHLTVQQKNELEDLLWERNYMFAENLFELGEADRERHKILTKDQEFPYPVFTGKRNYSEEHNKFMKEEVQKMLSAGIIQESSGDWSSAPVIVEKKPGPDGVKKLRMCIDFRKLNARTEQDRYPIPEIEGILRSFHGAKYYTTLDLASGYWQIVIEEQDQKKTAFQIENGFYEFIRMPFGLTNAPATFQRLMDSILRDIIGEFVRVYLDDIIIYSENWEDHIEHITEVFNRLEKAGLRMGKDKCDFAKEEISFLGHIVNKNGIEPDPKKLELIKDWKELLQKKKTRSFVGLMSY